MVTEVVVVLKTSGRIKNEDLRRAIDKVNEALEGLKNSPQVKIIFK